MEKNVKNHVYQDVRKFKIQKKLKEKYKKLNLKLRKTIFLEI